MCRSVFSSENFSNHVFIRSIYDIIILFISDLKCFIISLKIVDKVCSIYLYSSNLNDDRKYGN